MPNTTKYALKRPKLPSKRHQHTKILIHIVWPPPTLIHKKKNMKKKLSTSATPRINSSSGSNKIYWLWNPATYNFLLIHPIYSLRMGPSIYWQYSSTTLFLKSCNRVRWARTDTGFFHLSKVRTRTVTLWMHVFVRLSCINLCENSTFREWIWFFWQIDILKSNLG